MIFVLVLMLIMVAAWTLGMVNQLFFKRRVLDDIAAGVLLGTAFAYVSLLFLGVFR